MKNIEKFDILDSPTELNIRGRKSINPERVFNIDANDDERERAKRKSMVHLDENENDEMTTLAGDKMTSEEVADHHKKCIKLYCENKINVNNAFKLHLIDYLKSQLNSIIGFKEMTSSLEAGSIIYSARVDKVYLNICNLTTCIRDKNANEMEEEMPIDENQENNDERVVKTAKRKKTSKKIIASDISKLRLADLHQAEVDVLYRRDAEKCDSGGVDILGLCLCDINHDELVIDYDTNVISSLIHQNTENTSEEITMDIKLDGFLNFEAKVSNHFRDFEFMNWNPNQTNVNTIQNSIDRDSFMNLLEQDKAIKASEAEGVSTVNVNELAQDLYTDFPIEIGGDDDINFIDDIPNQLNEANNSDNSIKPDISDPIEEDEEQITIVTKRGDHSENFLSSVDSFVHGLVNVHGAANSEILGMWAGPDFWKQKSKAIKSLAQIQRDQKLPSDADNDENKSVSTVRKDKRAQRTLLTLKPIFPVKIRTKIKKTGLVKMVIPEIEVPNFQKDENQCTQLTECSLTKNLKMEHILPPSSKYRSDPDYGTHYSTNWITLDALMNRRISLVNRSLQSYINKDPTAKEKETNCMDSPLDNEDDDYKFVDNNKLETNNNNSIEMIGIVQSTDKKVWIADDDGNVINDVESVMNEMPLNDDYDEYDDGGIEAGITASITELQMDPQLHQIDGEFDELDNVRKVNKIDINYAKSAKRVNVRRLKAEMFNSIQQTINAKLKLPQNSSGQKSIDTLPMVGQQVTLTEVRNVVDKRLPKDTSKDLSMEIVVNCLFHLANEAGFCIEQADDLLDLNIGQGYSAYDIEQIKQYGCTTMQCGDDPMENNDAEFLPNIPSTSRKRRTQIKFSSDESQDNNDDNKTKNKKVSNLNTSFKRKSKSKRTRNNTSIKSKSMKSRPPKQMKLPDSNDEYQDLFSSESDNDVLSLTDTDQSD